MHFRGAILLVCAILAVWLMFTVVVARESEPQYAGRRLGDWLVQLHFTTGSQHDKAVEAVRAMGEETVPYLLSDVRYETTKLKMTLGAFAERYHIRPVHLPRKWTEPRLEQEMGVDGFCALGDKGAGAIPSLALYLSNGPYHFHAASALAGIGPASIPALANALHSPYQQARFGAVVALGHLGPAARPALPALLELYQQEPDMRTAITNELVSIDEQALARLPKYEPPAVAGAR